MSKALHGIDARPCRPPQPGAVEGENPLKKTVVFFMAGYLTAAGEDTVGFPSTTADAPGRAARGTIHGLPRRQGRAGRSGQVPGRGVTVRSSQRRR